MNEWRWEDPHWQEKMGGDSESLLLECLRRAVDIRDRSAEGVPLRSRPVMLVAALNALTDSMGVTTGDLWDTSSRD
jgi:hypothetical protein